MATHSSTRAKTIPWTETTVHRVTKNHTQLKQLSTEHNYYILFIHQQMDIGLFPLLGYYELHLDKHEQLTGSNLRKEYIKAVYYHLAYLTSMQNTSCDMPGWMKHKLESRLLGEIPIISDIQMTSP